MWKSRDFMDLPNRKHPRLKDYDYSSVGAYFITVCARNKECIFSRITVGRDDPGAPETALSSRGKIVEKYILSIPKAYADITVENYIIMPNHVHILMTINDNAKAVSENYGAPRSSRPTVSSVIGALKRFTNRETGEKLWQTSFYDHIVRDENDFLTRWQYIDKNPAKWYYELR